MTDAYADPKAEHTYVVSCEAHPCDRRFQWSGTDVTDRDNMTVRVAHAARAAGWTAAVLRHSDGLLSLSAWCPGTPPTPAMVAAELRDVAEHAARALALRPWDTANAGPLLNARATALAALLNVPRYV